ncbi:hypothetical protein K5549_020101, partial [Capra hircus]
EFVEELNRLKTFANFPSSSPVSASALARAGFLYTGEGDTVRCFSCHAAVDRWRYGDSAIGRHRKVSPNCRFINGFYLENNAAQPTYSGVQNGQYKAENYLGNRNHFVLERPSETHAHYLLRTGQVVDLSDTVYPRTPVMCSEEARLKSFHNWPNYAHLTPRELARAGLYYTGIDDQVECFCCGGKLKNWEPCDRAWSEHRRHFPNCFFVLGRNINMQNYEARIITFGTWMYSVNKEQLARAGFYALGEGDKVQCFHCGGGLNDWKPSEDPWEQHAKWFPGCKYLLEEKGQEYVNNIHLTHSKRLSDQPTVALQSISGLQNPTSHYRSHSQPSHHDKIVQNPMVQEAIRMGFSFKDIKKTMEGKIQTSGSNYKSLEVLVADLVNAQKDNTQGESSQTSLQKGKEQQRLTFIVVCRLSKFNAVIHIQSVLNNVEEKYMIILSAFDHLYQKMRILQSHKIERQVIDTGKLFVSDPVSFFIHCSITCKSNVFYCMISESFCLWTTAESLSYISTEEQLRLLREEKLCKICMDRNIAVVFIPCGHLVTCKQCAEAVDKCPMCYTVITFKQKIFMS